MVAAVPRPAPRMRRASSRVSVIASSQDESGGDHYSLLATDRGPARSSETGSVRAGPGDEGARPGVMLDCHRAIITKQSAGHISRSGHDSRAHGRERPAAGTAPSAPAVAGSPAG